MGNARFQKKNNIYNKLRKSKGGTVKGSKQAVPKKTRTIEQAKRSSRKAGSKMIGVSKTTDRMDRE